MNAIVVSGIILFLLPLLLLVLYKTNAGVMFLAACAGLVLLGSLDPTVVTTAGAVVPGEGEAYVRLSIVMLSMVLAAMMFKNSVQGSAMFLHIGVVIFLAGTLWVLLPSATGVTWLLDSTKEPIWQDIKDFESIVIAGGFSLSLFAVMSRRKTRRSSH